MAKRKIIWMKAAKRELRRFPHDVQTETFLGLQLVVEGQMPDFAKPLKGLGSGVFELRIAHRSDAYRVVYAVKLGEAIYVVHAFQKKSTIGIKTPQKEIDLVRHRIRTIREQLK